MANILLSYWYKLYMNQTPCEEIVERYVATLGVRYRTQHPFLGQKSFTDFYFPDHNIVLEIDDPSHNRKSKRKKDLQRTKRLEALGLTIYRITNESVLASQRTDYSPISQEDWKTRLRQLLGGVPPTHEELATDTSSRPETPSPKRKAKTASRRR